MGLSIDRDEVISGLEKCAASECNEKCPYNGINYGCRPRLMLDAVELLKEQEPKRIVRKQGKREYLDGSIDYFGEWYCPHCGELLNRGFATTWIKFCYKCGKAVEWE